MTRALSPAEILRMNKRTIPFTGAWYDAFGEPERTGVWFLWGGSGNGKSSFAYQLAGELSKHGKTLYVPLEEEYSLSTKNSIERHSLSKNKDLRFGVFDSIDELSEHLKKPRRPEFVIIDSFQYTQMTYKTYLKFKREHRNKLIVFVSHASGNMPSGRSAVSVMYDSALKIHVSGYRAVSRGRFIGPVGYYTIWEEGAARCWDQEKL